MKRLFVLIIAMAMVLLFISHAHASPIIISEAQSYRNWNDTAWVKNHDLKIGTDRYPYLVTEDAVTKTFTCGTDTLNIPKNIVDVFHLSPDKISFEIHTTKGAIAVKSIANGTGQRYIPIPQSALKLRFLFDDVKPDILINNGTDEWYADETTYWYSRVNGNIRLNFLTAPYQSLYLTDKIIFKFNSYDVNTSSTLSVDAGLYEVSTDFTCETTCLTIGAHNITLDLMGHTLSYANTTTGIGVTNTGYDNVTVMNGTLYQINQTAVTARGIYWYNGANNGNITKINNDFNGTNNYGIYITTSSNNNTITSNNNYNFTSGLGIYIYLSSNNNTITSNNNYNFTSGLGIYLSSSSSNNTITSNNNYNFTSGQGIYLSSSSNNNTITSNNNYNFTSGLGIYLTTSSNNNTITSNNNYNFTSGRGIYLTTSSSNNIITSNNNYNFTTGYGIYLSSSSSNNTITSNNNYNFTTGYGIYIYLSSNNNTITLNTCTLNTGNCLYLSSSHNNNLTFNTFNTDSSTTTIGDVAVANSYANNTFINNDQSKPRKTTFYDNVSQFNYSNGSDVFVSTQNIGTALTTLTTNRSLYNWTQSNITFSETWTAAKEIRYNISGLLPSTDYQIYNGTTIDYNYTTDTSGVLTPFTINFTATAAKTIKILQEVPPTFAPYIPPTPVSLANTSGNYWVNYTWSAGSGNVTNSYNVSQNNTWSNGSLTQFINTTLLPHGWSNISVYAFNSSGSGTLNITPVSSNTQLSNNAPVQNLIGSQSIDEENTLSFQITSTDVDNDNLSYTTNATHGYLNSTGYFTWLTNSTDAGTYHWNFNTTDTYSVLDTEIVTITVNEITITTTTTTGSSTGGGGSGWAIEKLNKITLPTSSIPIDNTETSIISSDSFTKTFYYKTKSPLSLSVYDISFKSDCDNVQLSITNINNIITTLIPAQCKAYDVRTQILIPNTPTPDLIYFKLYDILWINKPYRITGISSDNNYLLVTVQSSDMGQFRIMKEERFYEIRQLKDNPRIIIDVLSKIDNEIYTLLKEKLNL